MDKKELDQLLSWTEAGHIFLKSEELNSIGWGPVGENLWQEVSVMWQNYPVFNVVVIEKTEQELIDLIVERYSGWEVLKNCLEGLPTHNDGSYFDVVGEEE